MKLFASLFLCVAAASAQSTLLLSVENQGPVRVGNTLQLKAQLSGSTAATQAAIQFSIRATVPGTWSVLPGTNATAAGKTFTCAQPDAGNQNFRCILAGLNANVIQDGVVGTLSLTIPASAPDGQVSLIPSGLYGATVDGSAVNLTGNTVNFTLASPLSPCDINSDGLTNVQDVQLIITQILGPLALQTTDLDKDGKTTITDYQLISNAANNGVCRVQ